VLLLVQSHSGNILGDLIDSVPAHYSEGPLFRQELGLGLGCG